jgi:hypothetical protein
LIALAAFLPSAGHAGAGLRMVVTPLGEPRLSGEGTIDPAKVQKVISAHQRVLVACFEREAMRGVSVDGKLVLTWRIRPDGTTAGVRLVPGKSTMRNASVESCIFHQVMRWRFPAPARGEVTVVQAMLARLEEVPQVEQRRWVAHSDPAVSFDPSGKTQPVQDGPCRVTSGPLDADALRAFLRARHQAIGACLARSTAAPEPSLAPDAGPVARALGQLSSGSLQGFTRDSGRPFPLAGWTVSAAGTASDVKVTRGAVQQKEAEACLRDVLQGWSFPRRDGTSAVRCTFIGL